MSNTTKKHAIRINSEVGEKLVRFVAAERADGRVTTLAEVAEKAIESFIKASRP